MKKKTMAPGRGLILDLIHNLIQLSFTAVAQSSHLSLPVGQQDHVFTVP